MKRRNAISHRIHLGLDWGGDNSPSFVMLFPSSDAKYSTTYLQHLFPGWSTRMSLHFVNNSSLRLSKVSGVMSRDKEELDAPMMFDVTFVCPLHTFVNLCHDATKRFIVQQRLVILRALTAVLVLKVHQCTIQFKAVKVH